MGKKPVKLRHRTTFSMDKSEVTVNKAKDRDR
jgi:hypothetical protein